MRRRLPRRLTVAGLFGLVAHTTACPPPGYFWRHERRHERHDDRHERRGDRHERHDNNGERHDNHGERHDNRGERHN
jgi:hypothetical protein